MSENMEVGKLQLKTNRSLFLYIIFSLLTFGIYGLILHCSISTDINLIASKYDGKKTMHYALLAFIVSPITLGIGLVVWFHKFSNRIQGELDRRNIAYSCNAGTFWLWYILGSFILIGPIIYMHKVFTAMNLLSEDYNVRG